MRPEQENGIKMWFKNLMLYQFTDRFSLELQAFEAALGSHRFRPCGQVETATEGWVSPYGKDDPVLVHSTESCMLFILMREEKILPASVVNDALAEKIEEIEADRGVPPGKKERAELRDQVINSLLPRAFTVRRRTQAFIDLSKGWLLVDSTSSKKAEQLITVLRQSLGSLPVERLMPGKPVTDVMTAWLSGYGLPQALALEDTCELRDQGEDGGIIRCRKHDLAAPEVLNHLEAGKKVTRLSLAWRERLSFHLDDQFGIKGLKILELHEEADPVDHEGDDIARLDADFRIMHGEISALIPDLLLWMSAENK
ncbi:MAG: recombination-associated protein RdgC [Pseudomonadota bacterium]